MAYRRVNSTSRFHNPLSLVQTYSFENVDLLRGSHKNFSVLLQVLMHHIISSRCASANCFHLEFHLFIVSTCQPEQISQLQLPLCGGMAC